MWGDHLLASLRRPHHIYYPVRTGLAFLFLHLPQNDTIPRILWMRIRRHICLHREVWCRCSFCQPRSGFCNYGTDRLKSWISVIIIFYMCLISPISCVRLINEWQSVDCSQSRVACQDFIGLWLLKAQKKIVFVTDSVVQNFPEAEVQKKVNLVY